MRGAPGQQRARQQHRARHRFGWAAASGCALPRCQSRPALWPVSLAGKVCQPEGGGNQHILAGRRVAHGRLAAAHGLVPNLPRSVWQAQPAVPASQPGSWAQHRRAAAEPRVAQQRRRGRARRLHAAAALGAMDRPQAASRQAHSGPRPASCRQRSCSAAGAHHVRHHRQVANHFLHLEASPGQRVCVAGHTGRILSGRAALCGGGRRRRCITGGALLGCFPSPVPPCLEWGRAG